ncbi:hypothetical protein J4731_14605 [Providencia rettgeri]|nr:hypothetical protein [Providencia rettgeri]
MNNKIEIKANSYDFQDINSLGLQLKNHPGLSDIQLKNQPSESIKPFTPHSQISRSAR